MLSTSDNMKEKPIDSIAVSDYNDFEAICLSGKILYFASCISGGYARECGNKKCSKCSGLSG